MHVANCLQSSSLKINFKQIKVKSENKKKQETSHSGCKNIQINKEIQKIQLRFEFIGFIRFFVSNLFQKMIVYEIQFVSNWIQIFQIIFQQLMQDSRSRQMTTNPNMGMKPSSVFPIKMQNDKQFPFPQIPIQNLPHRNSNIDKIHKQIKHVDYINRQLLNIAQKVRTMGPMQNIHTNHATIDRIQNDLRMALNELIQNIMQFFKDIDAKLKNLGVIVNSQFQRQMQSSTRIENTTSSDAKYQLLAERIKGLEVSLRETQQNEKKLVQVIQNLMERYQVLDQPTLIRDTPALHNQFRKARANTSSGNLGYQEDVREFKQLTTMPSTSYIRPDTKAKSIYENLYTIEQSVVKQQITPHHFRLRQIQQDPSQQVFIKKLYSKNPAPGGNPDLKKSLRGPNQMAYPQQRSATTNKQQRSTATQSSLQDDKQHRLNFMMGKLNI